jgi:flagellar biosynthesis/type III secretory pathway ATPase
MTENLLDQLRIAVQRLDPVRAGGRVRGVCAGTVQIGGLPGSVQIGDRARIVTRQASLTGEIVRLDPSLAHLLVDGAVDGVSIGDRVIIDSPADFAPDDSWIGRVIDPDGCPLDERALAWPGRAVPARCPARATPAARTRAAARHGSCCLQHVVAYRAGAADRFVRRLRRREIHPAG